MTRRKNPPPEEPDSEILDPEREDFGAVRVLNRKQVTDMIRRKESFDEADLRGCDLSGLVFDGLSFVNAKFAEATLVRCSFRNANLSGASFFGANLKDGTLDEANLEEADFDYCLLDGVSFRGAKVRKALFPLKKLPLDTIRESIRTGKRVSMEPFRMDEDE
jgi:uncharacterized protein YjbI with pentapeptide repeats